MSTLSEYRDDNFAIEAARPKCQCEIAVTSRRFAAVRCQNNAFHHRGAAPGGIFVDTGARIGAEAYKQYITLMEEAWANKRVRLAELGRFSRISGQVAQAFGHIGE